MATHARPKGLGPSNEKVKNMDPVQAIKKMEDELKEMASSLRRTRQDYVSGMLTEEEITKVESQFMQKLSEQRHILQLLRSAAGK